MASPSNHILAVCRLVMMIIHGSEKQDMSWASMRMVMNNPKAFIQQMVQVSNSDISGRDPHLIELMVELLSNDSITN